MHYLDQNDAQFQEDTQDTEALKTEILISHLSQPASSLKGNTTTSSRIDVVAIKTHLG